MTRRLHVEGQASLDISRAALWYEGRREGLGLEFLDQLESLFQRIVESPLQFPQVEGEVRRTLLLRFPHGVYFTQEEHRVSIQAVLHLHRHPDSWRR